MIFPEYSQFQIEVLLETVKVLIPVCTAFLVLVSVFFRYSIEKNLPLNKIDKFIFVCIYFWSVIAIGLWSGVLAFLVDCAAIFKRTKEDTVALNMSHLNLEWNMAELSAEIAHFSFLIAVIIFSFLAYRRLIKKQ